MPRCSCRPTVYFRSVLNAKLFVDAMFLVKNHNTVNTYSRYQKVKTFLDSRHFIVFVGLRNPIHPIFPIHLSSLGVFHTIPS